MTPWEIYFCFDPFRVAPSTGELFRGSQKISLPQEQFHLLVALLLKAGEITNRETLCSALWPEIRDGVDSPLTATMCELQAALGDEAANPQFIETLGADGYRFIGRLQIAMQPKAIPETPTQVSLAVIPFDDIRHDGSEIFTYGLTEQLIARLGHTRRFVIVAPPSTIHYKHVSSTISQTCRALNAGYLLCGSVLGCCGQERVYVRLIQGQSQCCVWVESYLVPQYATDTDEMFTVQDAIAVKIRNDIAKACEFVAEATGPLSEYRRWSSAADAETSRVFDPEHSIRGTRDESLLTEFYRPELKVGCAKQGCGRDGRA